MSNDYDPITDSIGEPVLPRDPDYLPPSTSEGEPHSQPTAEHEAVVADAEPAEQPVIADPLGLVSRAAAVSELATGIETPGVVQGAVQGVPPGIAALIGTPQVTSEPDEPEPEPKVEMDFYVDEVGTHLYVTMSLGDVSVFMSDKDSSPILSNDSITALRDSVTKRARRALDALLA